MRSNSLCLLAAALLTFTPNGVRAESAPPPSADAATWNDAWLRFQWWEGVGSGALMAEAFTVRFAVDWSNEPTWVGGILFDDWARRRFRVEDPSTAKVWETAGDIPYYSSLAWAVGDPFAVAAVTGDWTAATQMFLMNFEGYAVFAATLWTTQFFVRRQRPRTTEDCPPNPGPDADVGSSCTSADRNRSFLSGHTGATVTNAALTCLHHMQMDLYGKVGDAVTCGAWIAASSVTFASRTALGQHYLTDNLLGATLGVASGFLVPYLLHYGRRQPPEQSEQIGRPKPRVIAVGMLPTLNRMGATIQLQGRL